MCSKEFVALRIPVDMKTKIDQIAEKKLSNFSQVFREAAQKGLEQMGKDIKN